MSVYIPPLLAAVLELRKRVDFIWWPDECYIGREENLIVRRAICWRGLIIEACCAYSISSLVWAISTAEKAGGGGRLLLGVYGSI
jgi:hypothetical protein